MEMVTAIAVENDNRIVSIVTLIERIALEGDRAALHECLPRLRLDIGNGDGLTFLEWVHIDRQRAYDSHWGRCRGADVVDAAYDLLLDRFCGPDCRGTYRGFLACVERQFEKDPPCSRLAEEVVVADLFWRCVRRHKSWCIQESIRSRNPLISRYSVKGGGRTVTFWFPKYFKGRRDWLETNIPDWDLLQPEGRDEVQALIDKYFGIPCLISLALGEGAMSAERACAVPDMTVLDRGQRPDIQELIAEEKASCCDLQRPSIKAIGPEHLRALVLRLLSRDSSSESLAALAKEFGVTPPTLTRFAGDIYGGKGLPQEVPDLYVNIAWLLVHHPVFIKAAQEAVENFGSMFQRAEEILQNAQEIRMEAHNNAQ